VLIKEKKFPELAELINHILLVDELKNSIINAGHKRIAEFSLSDFQARVGNFFYE
jgi:hypothetical protein